MRAQGAELREQKLAPGVLRHRRLGGGAGLKRSSGQLGGQPLGERERCRRQRADKWETQTRIRLDLVIKFPYLFCVDHMVRSMAVVFAHPSMIKRTLTAKIGQNSEGASKRQGSLALHFRAVYWPDTWVTRLFAKRGRESAFQLPTRTSCRGYTGLKTTAVLFIFEICTERYVHQHPMHMEE